MSKSRMADVTNCTGRREFLKSLLGLSAPPIQNNLKEEPKAVASFYWADLRTGQIGFPTGLGVDCGLPGSVMKLITTAVLCDMGKSETYFDCSGAITINNNKYICLKPHGHILLTEALAQSCNVYFAQATKTCKIEEIIYYARLMGMERAVAGYSGLKLPENPRCIVQDVAMGLSNALSFHALQILQLVSIIALEGMPLNLHSAEESVSKSQNFTVDLPKHTWSVLQQGMRMACRIGTANKLDPSDRLKIAAKTGTVPHGKSFQSWIAGYFPYEHPKYAFCLHAKTKTSQEAIPLLQKYLFDIEWP